MTLTVQDIKIVSEKTTEKARAEQVDPKLGR